MAKAILISPEESTLTVVEIEGKGDIQRLIGFDTLESDAIEGTEDRLFFDEECFIRGATGRFQLDRLIPVAGKGVVAKLSEDGESIDDVTITIEELRDRTRFE
jgi:hypothetical protein